MRRLHPNKRYGSRGIALIAVVWAVSLLVVMATAALAITRTHQRVTARTLAVVRAETVADSAIRIALLRLSAADEAGRALAVAPRQSLTVLGQNVRLTLEAENGRIDLNAADTALLAAVLAASEFSVDEPRSLAERIVDWRDADDIAAAHGAELNEYQQQRIGYGPRNGPFESVDELRQVLGFSTMPHDVLNAFTVYSHRPVPTPPFPALVARAMSEIGQDTRAAGPPAAEISYIGEVVRLRACIDEETVRMCRTCVARPTGSTQRPFQVFAWFTQIDTATVPDR